VESGCFRRIGAYPEAAPGFAPDARRLCRFGTVMVEPSLMSRSKMHADEVELDASLVGRLLATQFPQWADLPIEPVHSGGTDNAIYRLGDDMAVRLPRIYAATEQVEKEHLWLPRLAPLLPLAIPVPLGKGTPAEGYPWHWSVYRTAGPRPSGGSPIHAKRRPSWVNSSPPCSGSIPPAGRPLGYTTLPVRAAGSMETSRLGTCWPNGGGSAPSSTSGVLAWAIPHAM
jgi:Phosphotransferase enzyme family